MDAPIRRKTLQDFQRELKACNDRNDAREVVAQARLALRLDEYRALQQIYRTTWESQTA